MNREARAEEFDRKIDSLMTGRTDMSPEWNDLLSLGGELRYLPSPQFRNRLKSELVEQIGEPATAAFEQVTSATVFAEILPTLTGRESHMLPTDQRSFVVSFISHTALIALIASGIVVGRGPLVERTMQNSEITYLPAGGGGGGSGDRSPIPATKGTPPRMMEQQLAPAIIVVRNPEPLLPVQPTVVGPPDIKLPQSNRIGDLVSSNVVIPSNGNGNGGAAGDGLGSGLGVGTGLGVGPGSDRGTGGQAYRLSARVIPPKAIYDPEPEYSEEARKVKHEGMVVLSLVIDEQGRPKDIHVARSLGMGLDEKAIEAVRKWKFAPGTKDGIPVAVEVNVEVNFRLF